MPITAETLFLGYTTTSNQLAAVRQARASRPQLCEAHDVKPTARELTRTSQP